MPERTERRPRPGRRPSPRGPSGGLRERTALSDGSLRDQRRRAPHLRRGRPDAAWPSSTRRPSILLSERILRANYEKFVAAFAGLPGLQAVLLGQDQLRERRPLQTLRDLGSGAEVSGGLDLEAARRAGFAPQDIVFDGPCKTRGGPPARPSTSGSTSSTSSASPSCRLIDRLARERRRVVKVGVRIDPVVKNPSYGKLISTYKQKFGFPVNESGADLRAGQAVQERPGGRAPRPHRLADHRTRALRHQPQRAPRAGRAPAQPGASTISRDQPGRRLPGAQHDPAPRVAAHALRPPARAARQAGDPAARHPGLRRDHPDGLRGGLPAARHPPDPHHRARTQPRQQRGRGGRPRPGGQGVAGSSRTSASTTSPRTSSSRSSASSTRTGCASRASARST